MREINSHQPYEMWLYNDIELTMEQRTKLYQHLRECSHCRQIHQGWGEISHHISRAKMAKPAEGFSIRWRNSLDHRRAMQLRRQTTRIILGFSIAALISLGLLGLKISTGTFIGLLLYQMKSMARLLADTLAIIQMGINLIQIFSPSIIIFLALTATCLFSLLTILWIKTYMRVSRDGVY